MCLVSPDKLNQLNHQIMSTTKYAVIGFIDVIAFVLLVSNAMLLNLSGAVLMAAAARLHMYWEKKQRS